MAANTLLLLAGIISPQSFQAFIENLFLQECNWWQKIYEVWNSLDVLLVWEPWGGEGGGNLFDKIITRQMGALVLFSSLVFSEGVVETVTLWFRGGATSVQLFADVAIAWLLEVSWNPFLYVSDTLCPRTTSQLYLFQADHCWLIRIHIKNGWDACSSMDIWTAVFVTASIGSSWFLMISSFRSSPLIKIYCYTNTEFCLSWRGISCMRLSGNICV